MKAPAHLLCPWLALFVVLVNAGCGTVMEKNQVREPVGHLYPVRDPQFRRSVEALLGPAGPVVAQIQADFMDNWMTNPIRETFAPEL